MYDKCVIITRQTRLQELIARFNTRAQAKFYIEHAGGEFNDYVQEDANYQRSLDSVRRQVAKFDLAVQVMDRQFLPNFVFAASDMVIAVGQDGLVANAAKYVGAQPIIGVNPDPQRFDGILVQTSVEDTAAQIGAVLTNSAQLRHVSLAEVTLNDGQRLLAFNDLFLGARSHVSARYTIQFGQQQEQHSSSGIIVSTGAGSTGWLSSVFNMVSSVSKFMGGSMAQPVSFGWESHHLMFIVREPFISKHSNATVVAGSINEGERLVIESRMPIEGTIFSDGVENDYLPFNSGAIASIGLAKQQAHLVVKKAPVVRKDSKVSAAVLEPVRS